MAPASVSSHKSDGPWRLQMQGVHKRFGATYALRGVDFSVQAGEVHALVGENGAGKSTLMKVLSGAHPPDRGRMWLDGEPYAPRGPLDARQSGVAMIYQELSLAPHLTVMENILLGIEPAWGPLVRWSEMRHRALDALRDVGARDVPPDVPLRWLPLAKQQMVEIARAVAVQSRVLVLDEPTSSLPQSDIEKLFALIRRLKAKGLAIVYISHFLEEVQEISDRFTVLRDGQTVGAGITARSTVGQIVALMVGREVGDLYPRRNRRPGQVVLEVQGLAGVEKPAEATLALCRGEILGIAGLVGAGRTELVRALFGLDAVTSGRVKGSAPTAGRPRLRCGGGSGWGWSARTARTRAWPWGFRLPTISRCRNWTAWGRGDWSRPGGKPPPRGPGSRRSPSGACRPISPPARYPAATSRRWPWPGSCTRTLTYCSWTSPPAASTWAPRCRSTGSSTSWPEGIRPPVDRPGPC